MPSKGFLPSASALRRIPRSSSFTPRGRSPAALSSPSVSGRFTCVPSGPCRLPARIARLSPGHDQRDVLPDRKQPHGRASRELPRAAREPFELRPLEPDDGLADPAVRTDQEERRNVREPERRRRLPGLRVEERFEPDSEANVELARLPAAVLRNGERRQASLSDPPDAIEVRPRELRRLAGGLEESVQSFGSRGNETVAGLGLEHDLRKHFAWFEGRQETSARLAGDKSDPPGIIDFRRFALARTNRFERARR